MPFVCQGNTGLCVWYPESPSVFELSQYLGSFPVFIHCPILLLLFIIIYLLVWLSCIVSLGLVCVMILRDCLLVYLSWLLILFCSRVCFASDLWYRVSLLCYFLFNITFFFRKEKILLYLLKNRKAIFVLVLNLFQNFFEIKIFLKIVNYLGIKNIKPIKL